jgi:hypothetical protein
MKHTTIQYLDSVRVDTGLAHTGAERQIGGAFVPVDATGFPVEVRRVEPTTVDLGQIDLPSGCSVQVGWGDRVKRGETPPVWIARLEMTPYADHPIPAVLVPEDELPDGLLAACRERVAAAWLADIEARPDVASVVEHYRSSVLDALDRQYETHRRQWDEDVRAIAQKFRRKWVEVGEQTVPGKCVVRSSRGNTLGYADVWDGRWLGTVQRIRNRC